MRHEVPVSLNETDLTALIPGLSAFRGLCVTEPVNDKRGKPTGKQPQECPAHTSVG